MEIVALRHVAEALLSPRRRERLGRSGGAGARRAHPRAVDEASAAPAADGERLSRELLAEVASALSGPDLPERRFPHVADEVIGEVPAEADLAVRLDLSEIPGHRAEVVAEGLSAVGEVAGHAFGRHVRSEEHTSN